MKKIVTIFISLLLPIATILSFPVTANSEMSPRIIGGTEAVEGDWPFMTALLTKNSVAAQGQFCGGSFIGGRYILTAAHCVNDNSADRIDVLIGVNDLKKTDAAGQRVAVQAIYINENYDSKTIKNDIAIIELKKELSATKIDLATEMDTLTTGDPLTVMGWGNLSTTTYMYPTTLNQVNIPYVDRSTCKNLGGNYAQLGDDSICAGYQDGGYDSCDGDSGGPLLYNGKQVGIVSRGDGCAQADAYGIYTNVAYFNHNGWIKKTTSGVSYTQITNLIATLADEETNRVSFTLPIRNYSTEPLTVTKIALPTGFTIINDSCSATTLNQNESCELQMQLDTAAAASNSAYLTNYSRSSTITVTTDHRDANELKMQVLFFSVKSSTSSSGGASLGLALLALFGLIYRRKRGQ